MLEMTLVEAPNRWPPFCLICKDSRGPVVNTHSQFRLPGGDADTGPHIWICKACAERVARVVDFVPRSEFEDAVREADELDRAAREFMRERDEALQRVEQMKEVFHDLATDLVERDPVEVK